MRNLTSVILPEGLTTIGEFAFRECGFTHINIPKSVVTLDLCAFQRCRKLESIHIPAGVREIGESTLDGCNSLTTITVDENNAVYDSRDNCNAIIRTEDNTLMFGCPTTVIPQSVTSIGDYAFSERETITTFVIPDWITSIGEGAFESCISLTSITIPESVTSLGGWAFNYCESLTSITLPTSLTELGDGTFARCPLKTITIPKSITSIVEDPFYNCKDLEALIVEGNVVPSIPSEKLVSITLLSPIPMPAPEFAEAVFAQATLYVPQGSLALYQEADGWSKFHNILEIEDSTPKYLTIRQADNGAMGIAVDFGRTYKVCITPSEGWTVHSVTFNGEDITAQLGEDNTLTTPTINGSTELNVAYERLGCNEVKSTRANAIKVSGYEGVITVDGCADGENITIYTADGAMIAQQETEGESTRISVTTGQLYIIKVVDMVVKILM